MPGREKDSETLYQESWREMSGDKNTAYAGIDFASDIGLQERIKHPFKMIGDWQDVMEKLDSIEAKIDGMRSEMPVTSKSICIPTQVEIAQYGSEVTE